MIPVAERKNVPGFGPWSIKAGVVHVKPPAAVLAGMLALRVHLDDCGMDNGPLRVLPGSHRHGFLSSAEVREWIATREPVTCIARRGDVLAMRPLLLHASSPAEVPAHRRVLHIEYSAQPLPSPLRWHVA
jgi:ectoine hydroxylase-related dioxygenase (phytanoyl-CoA dioxygenase family)